MIAMIHISMAMAMLVCVAINIGTAGTARDLGGVWLQCAAYGVAAFCGLMAGINLVAAIYAL